MRRNLDLSECRELDARSGDGIDVQLLWQTSAEEVLLYVADARTGEELVLVVPGVDALEAFRHPFAYASAQSRETWSGSHHERYREEVAT